MNPAVLVMAKAPVPGQAKTRLEPLLGPAGCAALQEELIHTAVSFAREVAPEAAYLAVAGDLAAVQGLRVLEQRGASLGERLKVATEEVFAGRDGPLIVIGTDCPQLGAGHAAAVQEELAAGRDAALIPARDGGYCLIALARPAPELFELPPEEWGGPRVLEHTLTAAAAHGLDVGVLAPESDLDTSADAAVARADLRVPPRVRAALAPGLLLSVVVPVLNEAKALPGLLDGLAALPGRIEVVVVDGGSTDGTPDLARAHGSRPAVCATSPGRARQMNRGAREARGDVLLFLHADTRLPARACQAIAAAVRDPGVPGGNFALRFDGGDAFSRGLGAWYRLQRRAGIYYGDSAVWVRREVFDRMGGFRPLPIMEDYDFVRRLESCGRTVCLAGPAVTSARRWRALGVRRTVLSWVVIRWLFLAGVSPDRLARLYHAAR